MAEAAALAEKAAREPLPAAAIALEAVRGPRVRMAPGASVVARVRRRAVAPPMQARRSAAAKVAYRMAGENMPARIAPRLPTMVRSDLAVSEC